MLNVAEYKNVDRLPKGYGIPVEDIEETIKKQGLNIIRDCAILVRTGQMSVWSDERKMSETYGAGVTLESAKYLVEGLGAVVVGSDTMDFEKIPSGSKTCPMPVHVYLLVEMGVHIIEMMYLEELARDKIYEFIFVVTPLKIRGATASMVRPIAIC
jgi:kynurenine formamidase